MKSVRLLFAAGLLLGLAAGLTAQTTPAPRSFTSYFFFGDSLSDMGNTFYVSGSPPAPYYNGRFSNGPVYAEYLVNGLQRSTTAPATATTNLNFAFGGATATQTYMSSSTPANLGQEVAMFQARGLTPKSTDLFVVWAGANDVLNYLGSTASPTGAGANTAASAAVTAVTSSVQTLVTAGARNVIVMTLPDISRTARFVTGSGAPAASLAQGAVYTYGTGIRTSMAALAASSGARITLVDTTALLNTIILHSTTLGFTDTTHNVVDVLTAGGTVSNPNSYIFWDGIHPTTAVHALFARSLTEAINPEFVLGTAAVQGNLLTLAGDVVADTLDRRLNGIRGRRAPDRAGGFLTYSYADGGLDASGYRKQFDYSGGVVTGGFDARVTDKLTFGLAVSTESLTAKIKPGAGSFKLTGHAVTIYGQWKPGIVFFEGYGSLGSVDFKKIQRVTALGGLATTGETEGKQQALGARLGAEFELGGFRVTPFIGLRHVLGEISDYTESGVGGLNFAFGTHDVASLAGMAGVSGTWTLHLGEMPLQLDVSCVYQRNDSNTQSFSGQLADTVAPTTTIEVDTANGNTLKLGAQITSALSKRWSWAVGYTSDVRSDGKAGSQVSFSLQTGF